MAERTRQQEQQELVDLGPVALDGLEDRPDPFTEADERWLGEPIDVPSDEDRFGHLDVNPFLHPGFLRTVDPPLDEDFNFDYGLLGHELDFLIATVMEEVDGEAGEELVGAVVAMTRSLRLPRGIRDDAPIDAMPLADETPRAYFAIAARGAEPWRVMLGPFDSFEAAVVRLHHAAKRFVWLSSHNPAARNYAYLVLAVPADLTWVMAKPLFDLGMWPDA